MSGQPALPQRRQHAQRAGDFATAQAVRDLLARLAIAFSRVPHEPPGQFFIGQCQAEQHQPCQAGENAEPEVEEEQQGQIERDPGGIEEGEERIAGNELAQRAQVVQRLHRGTSLAGELPVEYGSMQAFPQPSIETVADTHQQA